ncbi:MAG: MBL fold metallo-hydrolase [Clostridiaceae bacterium]
MCSHAHVDHIGNNAYFKNKYNCIIAMQENEAVVCSSLGSLKTYYSNLTISEITERFFDMICETDILISNDTNVVKVCGVEFQILHTPGHSLSHICIITPDDVAYLGDSLISYEVMRGAKMPYCFNLKEDLESKSKLFHLKASKYIVAHKNIYNNITELITDNIEFYKNRANRVYSIIEGSMTIEEIFDLVIKTYNININNKYKCKLIQRILNSYIEYLKEIGLVKTKIDNEVIKYSKGL